MTLASAGGFAPRALVLTAVAALGAAMLATPEPVDRLFAQVRELPFSMSAGKATFDGVLVVDMSGGELAREARDAGLVAQRGEVLGEMTRYLRKQGARTVAFHLAFDAAQSEDSDFARSLGPRTVLAASAVSSLARPDGIASTPIAPGSVLRVPTKLSRDWAGFDLPSAALLAVNGVRAGIVNYDLDADGRVRRQPLLHASGGMTLPALPLAVLLAESDPSDLAVGPGTTIRLGQHLWPVNESGEATLRFPSNARALPTVSLARVALAAAGLRHDPELASLIRDRAIFIGDGSAGAARTPAGELAGVQLAAIAYTQLRSGLVATPSSASLDALLLLAALVPGFFMVARRSPPKLVTAASGAAIAWGIAALLGIVLALAGIAGDWTLAGLAGTVGCGAGLAWQASEARIRRYRRRYERKSIDESYRLKTEFLNHLTHELRTPLTAIMGFNKINQFTDELGKEARIANSAVIARNCEHLLALINNNLDLAKMEAGQLAIVRSPEDPEQIFRDVLATMRALAADKKLELRYVKRTRLPEALLLDAFRLRQVLINLMGNAVKFTARGSVELGVAWHVAALEIEVRDTGPGIAADALERIWQPFKQADLTVGKRFGGTGLGLAISQRLVEMMGGEIGVESTLGRGTTFRVRLPSEPVQPRTHGESLPPAQLAPNRERLSGRILLADDNEDLRALVSLLLRNLGLAVTTVENGLVAVETAVVEEVDVIMMDMEMPVMNGYEAVNVLRTRGYTGTIFGLTAHQDGPEVARAILSGCDAVLTKPISLDALKAALTPALTRTRSTRSARPGSGTVDHG